VSAQITYSFTGKSIARNLRILRPYSNRKKKRQEFWFVTFDEETIKIFAQISFPVRHEDAV